MSAGTFNDSGKEEPPPGHTARDEARGALLPCRFALHSLVQQWLQPMFISVEWQEQISSGTSADLTLVCKQLESR
jgi:hypothetical protein